MAETVRYTGDGNELFWRERVENLHAGAQVIVPDTHTLFIIRDGVPSAPLASGKHDVFPSSLRLKADESRRSSSRSCRVSREYRFCGERRRRFAPSIPKRACPSRSDLTAI